MKHVVVKFALVGALATLAVTGAHAQGRLAVRPVRPTTADTAMVVTGNGFSSMCWHPETKVCSSIAPDTLVTTTEVDYCGGFPEPCMCTQFPVSFLRYCVIGRLPAGSYVAKYVEVHTNPIDPIHTFERVLNFTVQDATPTLRRSWGGLKSRYR